MQLELTTNPPRPFSALQSAQHVINAQNWTLLAYNKDLGTKSTLHTQIVSSFLHDIIIAQTSFSPQQTPLAPQSLTLLHMAPHATQDMTNSESMSHDSAPLTNGETPRSKALSVRKLFDLQIRLTVLLLQIRYFPDSDQSTMFSESKIFTFPKRGCCCLLPWNTQSAWPVTQRCHITMERRLCRPTNQPNLYRYICDHKTGVMLRANPSH